MDRLISIGIPTFNRADNYLKIVLESVRHQSYSNFEVIVADNGSSDGTRELVAQYNDPRIRYYFHEPSLIPNDNFNFCLEQAKGEYFQLLHDDDLIDPTFLERCNSAIDESAQVGIVRTGVRTIDGDGVHLRDYPNEDRSLSDGEFIERWLDGRSMLILCSTLFNTKLLRSEGGFRSNKNLFQDVTAEVTLAKKYGRLDVRDVLASFRKHGDQQTNGNKLVDWCQDSVFLLDRICELYGSDASDLREKGLVHFAKHNYELASGIQGIGERYRAYLAIYRTFETKLSPFAYFSRKWRGEMRTALGKRKRAALGVFQPHRKSL